jgi:VanZ family protein
MPMARFGMVAMLAALAAMLEVTQHWLPDRHAQFIDFAASAAGACLGMLAVAIVDRGSHRNDVRKQKS